ncbi:c-type cytochrome [Flavihumibacter sp. R14]|nr:c-type cytochrome [Flavihumibacter soli]
MRRVNYILILSLLSIPAFGQENNVISTSGNYYMDVLIGVFIAAAVLLLAFAFVLLNTFKALAKELRNPSPLPLSEVVERLEYEDWKARQSKKPGIFSKILGLKPLEEEKDLLIEHEFDGIKELDNPVPGWFNLLFYGSIAVGFLYFITYHGTGWGQSQEQEYVSEMKLAEREKAAYLASSADKIDESNVKVSSEAGTLDAGKALFSTNCVACHGDKGQGSVGPNLTDEYWLHGGKIGSVFKTIKYGVPDKGMISWEKTLSPKQISEVSNYILSLKGTKPANPKAPQGDKEG